MLSDIFTRELTDWLNQCRQVGWRAIIHISGEQSGNWQTAQQVLQLAGFAEPLIMADQGHDGVTWQNRLGDETDCLVIDAYAGFNPNALGMASACIRAGGLLLLLTPPLNRWRDFDDPDYRRICSKADNSTAMAGRFIAHCCERLKIADLLVTIAEGEKPLLAPFSALQSFAPDFTEQQQATAAIRRVATGHARRPLVLSADRGRGKTAALGIACAALMKEKDIAIVVTAVSVAAVKTLFRHLADSLGQSYNGVTEYNHKNSRIQFMAVDRLLQESPDAGLVVIDEAAALPVMQLQECVGRYNRLVFSTTIDGYEGNGKGFSLRFNDYLKEKMPRTRYCELQNPIRWAPDDPLEKLVKDMLMLDASHQRKMPGSITGIQCFVLGRDQLLDNQALLHQLFGLLVQAHYQTSPDDLRLLLDHPGVRILAAFSGDTLLAVALLMQEGGFSRPVQQQVAEGRRFRGHLLPQSLNGDGYPGALAMSYERIMRIAVQPDLQRRGIGRQLIEYAEKTSPANMLGASFSAEPPVIRFWQSCGMQPVRLGSHKESGTGQYACIVLKALSDKAARLLQSRRFDWAGDIAVQLPALNHDMPAELVQVLLKGLPFTVSTRDVAQVSAYADGYRGFEQVLPSLYRCVLLLAAGKYQGNVAVMIDRVLLQQGWQQVAERYKLAGRKAVEQQMRLCLDGNRALLGKTAS